MYKDIKERIQNTFDSVAPDFLNEIKSAEIHPISSEEILFYELETETTSNKSGFCSYKIGYAIVAAILLFMISIPYYQSRHVTNKITIEADHPIEISLNRNDSIVKVEGMEENALISPSSLRGKKMEEGLNLILEAEYKDGGHNKEITIYYDSNTVSKKTAETILSISDRYSMDSNHMIKAEDTQFYPQTVSNDSDDKVQDVSGEINSYKENGNNTLISKREIETDTEAQRLTSNQTGKEADHPEKTLSLMESESPEEEEIVLSDQYEENKADHSMVSSISDTVDEKTENNIKEDSSVTDSETESYEQNTQQEEMKDSELSEKATEEKYTSLETNQEESNSTEAAELEISSEKNITLNAVNE